MNQKYEIKKAVIHPDFFSCDPVDSTLVETLKFAKVSFLPLKFAPLFPFVADCCYPRYIENQKQTIMQTTNDKLVAFLKENPNATRTAITEGTKLNGLNLFNSLKKLVKDGQVSTSGVGQDATYSLDETYSEDSAAETIPAVKGKSKPKAAAKKKAAPVKKQQTVEEADASKPDRRDNSKYKFNGEQYGKGPLVRILVAQYVQDNPGVTYKQLKEVFPDTLMKRFGVFANESEAKKLSGNKPRYFLKAEQMVKIKGQKEPIAICNQWTTALIEPFIKVAKELGYKIK